MSMIPKAPPLKRSQSVIAKSPPYTAPAPSSYIPRINLTTLGTDRHGDAVEIDDTPRLEHCHAIGATGSGKSNFLFHTVLQDISRLRGTLVIDPHGFHPRSLMNNILRYIRDRNWSTTKHKVHIMSPNVRGFSCAFNPLAPLPETEPSVIASAMVQAFEAIRPGENLDDKPVVQRSLQTTMMILADRHLTLGELPALVDYHDHSGFRRRIITELSDPYLRAQLERVQELAERRNGRRDFDIEVVGPLNRVFAFLANPNMRTTFSMSAEFAPQPAATFDLLGAMNRGDHVFVDLSPGPRASEKDCKLFGTILLRYLFLLMQYRSPYFVPRDTTPRFHPFFVYVDECGRFLTDDVGPLLAEARKWGVGVTLAHQFMAQLGKPRDLIYEAVRNCTELKLVFRIKGQEEAQELARDVLKLDLELPLKASIRPTVIGYDIGALKGSTYAVNEGESETVSDSVGRSVAESWSEMQNWAHASARGQVTTNSVASVLGDSEGWSTGSALSDALSASDSSSMSFTYDPATQQFQPMAIASPMPLSQNVARASASTRGQSSVASQAYQRTNSRSRSLGSATSNIAMTSDSVGGGSGHSLTQGSNTGRSVGHGTNRGTTRGATESEAILPVYADLPSSFHSLENAAYLAGETIRDLPVGECIARFRNRIVHLKIPKPLE